MRAKTSLREVDADILENGYPEAEKEGLRKLIRQSAELEEEFLVLLKHARGLCKQEDE